MERLVNVANKMEEPCESNTSSCGVTSGSHNLLIRCYGCEDILLGWLYGLDVCWLAFGFKWKIYVVPRQTALGFVQRANVVSPPSGEHEEHFITLCFWQFFQLWFPASFVPGILLQNRANRCNYGWNFLLQDMVRDSAAQHMAGDVPGEDIDRQQAKRGNDRQKNNQSLHRCTLHSSGPTLARN